MFLLVLDPAPDELAEHGQGHRSLVRELRTTRYQFESPFVVDSSSTEKTFGLAPMDLDVALKAVAP